MGRRTDLIKPPKEELELKYLAHGSTLSSLGKEYGTSHRTISSWLKSYEIPLKTHQQASTEANNRRRSSIPPRDIILESYDRLNLGDMQEYFGVGQETIYQWLDYYDITPRNLSKAARKWTSEKRRLRTPSKEEILDFAHSDECCSKSKLANKFGMSGSFMRSILKEYDIDLVFFRSEAEKELFDSCESILPGWRTNDRSIIYPLELDLVHDDLKLAIEYCGLYWHSETWGGKDKNYHLQKKEKCLKKGYDLITIFDSDNRDKVKNLLMHRMGLTPRIWARKCRLEEIEASLARNFHDSYHLQGFCGASVHLGLYRGNDLVMVGSFGKSRYNSSFEWECVRMTNLGVTGGTSKIFKSFGKDSMITYADRRFGEGLVYHKCGFERIRNSGPNYWYFNKDYRLYSRVMFQKHKLKDKLEQFDPSLTEWENMKMNGYDRIWDCGNAVYVRN